MLKVVTCNKYQNVMSFNHKVLIGQRHKYISAKNRNYVSYNNQQQRNRVDRWYSEKRSKTHKRLNRTLFTQMTQDRMQTFRGVSQLVSWYFEPSQPQRVTSWLKTMFNLSSIYSARKSSNHKLSINHKISHDTNLHKTKHTQTSDTKLSKNQSLRYHPC